MAKQLHLVGLDSSGTVLWQQTGSPLSEGEYTTSLPNAEVVYVAGHQGTVGLGPPRGFVRTVDPATGELGASKVLEAGSGSMLYVLSSFFGQPLRAGGQLITETGSTKTLVWYPGWASEPAGTHQLIEGVVGSIQDMFTLPGGFVVAVGQDWLLRYETGKGAVDWIRTFDETERSYLALDGIGGGWLLAGKGKGLGGSDDALLTWTDLQGGISCACGDGLCDEATSESCGTCASDCPCSEGLICSSVGTCECVPSCGGKACGDDGCGGSCGDCPAQHACTEAGACECIPDCDGKECGEDGCGGSCGECSAEYACSPAGTCVCVPDCAGKACGDDGCGGSCGACAEPDECSPAGACECVATCDGLECGDNACGVSCGSCPAGVACVDNQCACEYWDKSVDLGGNEQVGTLSAAPGGAVFVSGSTKDATGDFNGYILKLDALGQPVWLTTLGDTPNDYFSGHVATAAGDVIAVGWTKPSATNEDVWVARVGPDGEPLWQKTFGTELSERGEGILVSEKDGHILVTATKQPGAWKYHDFWALKLDPSGELIWEVTHGGDKPDVIRSVVEVPEGGYAALGYSSSAGAGNYDFWLMRLDEAGGLLWQKNYGGYLNELAGTVLTAPGGGFYLAGTTKNFGAGGSDAWVIRTDAAGEVVWDQTFGTPNHDGSSSSSILVHAPGGGIFLAGYIAKNGSWSDSWLWRLEDDGEVVWQRKYPTSATSFFSSVAVLSGGEIVAGGRAPEPDANGLLDLRVVRLDPNGVVGCGCGDGTCDASEAEDCNSCPDDCGCDEAAFEACAPDGKCTCAEGHPKCAIWCCDVGQICWFPAGGCCTPDCEGKVCGDDGCGGSCGECPESQACTDGVCS